MVLLDMSTECIAAISTPVSAVDRALLPRVSLRPKTLLPLVQCTHQAARKWFFFSGQVSRSLCFDALPAWLFVGCFA
jgi:hypothetical protein